MQTLLLAASLGLVLSGTQGARLNSAESRVWSRVSPSLITILKGAQRAGTAVLIEGRTMFIAHQKVVGAPPIRGVAYDGTSFNLVAVATDVSTQLVLLRSDKPMAASARRISIAADDPGKKLLAVLPSGVIHAELAGTGKMGMMNSSQRLFTLSEIRFESPTSVLAGAPVFNLKGNLVGLLGAALESPQPAVQATEEALGEMKPKMRSNLRPGGKFGPSDMTVAYSVTSDVIARVVAGFLSPSRQVEHQVIGVLISDSSEGGVRVEAVQNGSQAEAAGVRMGDIIVQINDESVTDKISYGRIMAHQRVGKSVRLVVKRGEKLKELRVRVGG